MAQMHSSATEYALENQRVGGLQIRVAYGLKWPGRQNWTPCFAA
jgi:hypothetical protein